jgi:hypothetical protein
MKIENMNLGSTASDLISVLTGKTAVQTQSAVTVAPETQDFITTLAIGAGAVIILSVLLLRR